MIAMSMLSTYDEYRRDAIASAPVYTTPTPLTRRAMLRALAMIGFGMGGVAAMDDDETLGIG